MSDKQDRVAPRTATDLERKYNFGKTFAEMLGLINDSREKVDKVESGLRDEINETATSLRRTTAEITMQAEQITKIYENIDGVNTSISEVRKSVETKMDADALTVQVKKELENGVTLGSGYSFTDDGLNISKFGEAMKNQLDHTGMYVTRNGEDILTANKDGVKAKDLHATTYLKIGSGDGRSRFEDYGIDRVGCFWIGG